MNLVEQLKLLSIFHYVVGALHAVFGSLGLIHFFIGLSIIFAPTDWSSVNRPPDWFGLLFTVLGGSFVVFGWALGALTIYSGRCIATRKKKKFSIVMGAINCVMVPLGMVLGIFTLIILTKDEIRFAYGEEREGPPPLPN